MARGLEIDWVVIRVHSVRKAGVLLAIGLAAAALVAFAYVQLNQPPETIARRAIERAEFARQRAGANPVPELWRGEFAQAEAQLESARTLYGRESWQEATEQASGARSRFDALMGADSWEMAGVGHVFSLEGRVTVQRAGKADWLVAQARMPVFNGDFVRTGRDGSAEVLFADGTLYRISPNSLLEIHHSRRAGEELSGNVKMMVGHINVYTSSAPSTVTTESTETEVARESRVTVGINDTDRTTIVAAYKGRADVSTVTGERVSVGVREQVKATMGGQLSAKRTIPEPPQPVEPRNNSAFELPGESVITLRWRWAPASDPVRLQVSRSKRFVEDEVDIDINDLRKDWARIKAMAPGTYYWRVATTSGVDLLSEWSAAQRFQVFSPTRRLLLEDRTPPPLEVAPPQQMGSMFIVEGRTEPGATVTVNGEPVESDGRGQFRKTVELVQEGWNELVVTAVDPSGNRSERRERVYVEVY